MPMTEYNTVVDCLLAWYIQEQRILPWRQTKDPYKIWISEIMLQQTRVDTVIDYYCRFINTFPSIIHLAEAELDIILKQWEGLGYYSRAKNIYKAARMVVEQYEGKFPNTYEQIIHLPGIGAYTAGAILSIAFNRSYPAVDGNVLRVISRIFLIQNNIGDTAVKKEIHDIVQFLIPEGRAGDFAQALMELGAVICIPRMPKCTICPVHSECRAYHENKQDELPIRSKPRKQKQVLRYIAIIKNNNEILMRKRREGELLGGLWEFPGVEADTIEQFQEKFYVEYGLLIQVDDHILDCEHIFTHIHWKMKVYRCRIVEKHVGNIVENSTWMSKERMNEIPIPTAFQKIKKAVF